jgi:hypothetical protein
MSKGNLKKPAICVRGFRSAIKIDPSMPIDTIIDYANKVCSGQIADSDNNTFKKTESMITLSENPKNSNIYKPYIRSATRNLIDVCTKKKCIPGKSKRCISKKNYESFKEDEIVKICYGERLLHPTVKELTNTLQNLIKFYVVSNGLIVGLIDTMDHFNIVVPEPSANIPKDANMLNV